MIPKIIHYTWFSDDPYPEKIKECMKSWKIHMPDYQFIHWDMEKIKDIKVPFLKEALEGFSNGIPVWVSQYEAIDTMDNEALCNNILSIDALDKRFTMMVLNKADSSDLPDGGFSEKQVKNILEYIVTLYKIQALLFHLQNLHLQAGYSNQRNILPK